MRMVSQAPFFRTDTQARLLALLFLRPDETWTLANLARELGVSASTLHPEIHRLEDSGLLTASTIGRARVLAADTAHPLAAPLTEILRYLYGPRSVIEEEFGRLPGVDRLLIFGSWAARQNGVPGPPPNDVDVLIVGDTDRQAVYAAADRSQERLGMPVNPVLASPKRWDQTSDALIRQIRSGPVITLIAPEETP
ncbi:HTH domain-containing protein [Herbidospora sp. NEAU-GS84]|uniref:HTH domain-containing protein n=1 Tax=Herbidospora solisilvae TaxID=2696284 RepID=A0A7C9N3W1_9ACTN|nr:helix-turn-helix domain-containing protein [Herbidospora solisilvae]NAS24969.1 HTH domain-containing protein [Herbidospora solisilvae]